MGKLTPDAPKFERTFLGIAKQPHYENVISNIYAFFFNIKEEHDLGDLFIRSLIELIKEKPFKKNLESFFIDFNIITEYPVGHNDEVDDKKKGRIDILLENHDGAIIIENKIYHYLNNPLNVYWDKINKPEKNKIGIVLSLTPLETKDDNFINIAHKEFIERIKRNLENIKVKEENKYLFFLKDFCQNIINLSSEIMNEEDLEAFNDKRKEIIEVSNYLNRVKKHVERQVESALKSLEEAKKGKYVKPLNNINKDRLMFLQSNNKDNLMITVLYEELFDIEKENCIHLIIEVQNKEIEEKTIEELKKNYKNTFKENEFLSWGSNGDILHLVSKQYKINHKDLTNLHGFIADTLEKDSFIKMFEELSENTQL